MDGQVSSIPSRHGLAVLAVLLGACGDSPVQVPCMNMDTSALATQSSMFELDDYGPGVQCQGAFAPDGAVPTVRYPFRAGDPLSVQLPPGPHTVVLLAFDDAMHLIGSGCVSQDLPAGGQICINLSLIPAPDMATDLSSSSQQPDLLTCQFVCAGDGSSTSTCCNAIHGTCAPSTCGISCVGLYNDCNQNAADGCEINLGAPESCGTTCGNKIDCTTSVKNATGIGCTGGACTFMCNVGAANCDSNPANGCEINLQDPTTCGTNCGTIKNCNTILQHTAGVTCSSGTCGYGSCAVGFGDCDSNPANGCETDLNQTTACGLTCLARANCSVNVKNATGVACSSGSCAYGACSTGFGDCDSDPTNGCETAINTITSCGATCGTRVDCTSGILLNATATGCSGTGQCQFSCSAGFGNCDGTANNGCEANLNAVTTCGTSCATAVNCNSAVKNANGVTCSSGTCGYGSCLSGFTDCDLNAANGCEAQLHDDGEGQTFTDCSVPIGTYTQNLAIEAANAWDSTGHIIMGTTSLSGGNQSWVCNNSTVRNHSGCWTWAATGAMWTPEIGQVFVSGAGQYYLPGSGTQHGSQSSWF
jgi:hypothetical protein